MDNTNFAENVDVGFVMTGYPNGFNLVFVIVDIIITDT